MGNKELNIALSPHEKNKLNIQNYEAYIKDLETTGEKFPLNQFGDVNLTAVAQKCKFNRQVFSNNKHFQHRLTKDIERIGTDIHKGQDHRDRDAEIAATKSQEASKLRRELDAKVQEIELLREELTKARDKILELENKQNEGELTLDEILSTGRRFTI